MASHAEEALRQTSDSLLEQIRAIEARTVDHNRDAAGSESVFGSIGSSSGAGNADGRRASRSPRRQTQTTSVPVEGAHSAPLDKLAHGPCEVQMLLPRTEPTTRPLQRPLWRGHAQSLGVNDMLRQTEPIMCQQNSLQQLPQQALQQYPQQLLQQPQDPGTWQVMQPAPFMPATMMGAAFPVQGAAFPVQAMMQQQFMMQQMMMAPMACMQQMMLSAQHGDLEEASRQMGKQAYDNAVNASRRRAARVEDSEDEAAPLGPSSDVSHPNYRPSEMETIPGVTDRRFDGKLKLWFEEKGYGFIESEELRKIYPDVDVFLHQNQKRHFDKGDNITFSIFMNFRGRPQGTELRRFKARPRTAG